MAIVRNDDEAIHEMLRHPRLNYMGQELLFASDDSSVCSDEYLARLRRDGILSWVNTPVYLQTIFYTLGTSFFNCAKNIIRYLGL